MWFARRQVTTQPAPDPQRRRAMPLTVVTDAAGWPRAGALTIVYAITVAVPLVVDRLRDSAVDPVGPPSDGVPALMDQFGK